jgi:hypothetical protein
MFCVLTKYYHGVKSRKMRWARHVARARKTRNAYRMLLRKPERELTLGDIAVDGMIILKWILVEKDVNWVNLAQDRVQ